MEESDITPDVYLREIDYNHLMDVEDNPEAVLFRVRLSSLPSEIWMQEFEHAYRATPYGIKPPLTIVEDTLEIVYLPRYSGELTAYFRFLEHMTDIANKETLITEKIHIAGSRDRHKQEMRDALRSIKLSSPT